MSTGPSQTLQKEQSSGPQKFQTLKTMQLKSLKSMVDGPPQEDDSLVDLQYEKELNTIDYEKMKLSVKKNHVIKDNGEFYGCKEACWNFNSGKHYLVKSSEASDLNKFGIGVMLYFKFVKHLATFFFLFTLLSIPAFVFYISAYSDYSETSNDSVSYLGALTATTVGSVGLGTTSCAVRKFPDYANQASEKTLYFQCYSGTIASVDKIIYGLVATGTTCTLIDETDITTSCNTYDTTALAAIKSACVGQTTCSIEVDDALFDLTDQTCKNLFPYRNVYMQVNCEADSITVAGNSVSKLAIAYVVAAIDAVIIIVFILMIYTLKYAQKTATNNVQKKVYSASSYTVEFRNLPQDMPAEELSAKLWTFIDGRLGENSVKAGHRVVDVQIVLPNKLIEYSKDVGTIIRTKNTLIREFIQNYLPDYAKTEIDFNGLQQIMKRMIDQNHPELKGAEKLFRRIKELSSKKLKLLSQIQKLKTSNNVRIVCAFVTFSSIPARNKILDSFISSPMERLARALCGRGEDVDFGGKSLRVRSSADPGSILWENLGEPGQKVFLRRALSWILTILLWVITAAILIVSTYYKNDFKDNFPTVDCSGRDPTDTEAATDYQLGEYQVGLLECYCSSDLVGRLNHVFTTADDATLCVTWFTNKVIETSITFAIVFVVLIINYVVQFVFQGLSQFEKHSTLNKQLATRVVKTFAAQFLNTGLILLLVNAKIDDISFWQGKFRDLSPLWYSNVGSTLLSTMLINVVTVPTVKLAALLLNRIARCMDRNCKSDERITKKKNQKSYEELYSGPEFIIDFRYSQILTLVFVSFLYSAGMPLLYFTSFLQLTITYFFDKVFLLKASKLPKNYDEKLESIVRPTLYVILFAHLIFAIFMFGSSTVFNQDSSAITSATSSTNMANLLTQKTQNVVKQFFRRTVMDFNVVLLVVLILLIALFLVKGIMLGFLRRTVFAVFTKDEEKTQKKDAKVAPDEQVNHTFFSVLQADYIANLIRLTKVTMKTTENKELANLLQTKLTLLQQEYKLKQQNTEPADFIGFYTYDVRLQPTYAAQFAINEMLDDESLE